MHDDKKLQDLSELPRSARAEQSYKLMHYSVLASVSSGRAERMRVALLSTVYCIRAAAVHLQTVSPACILCSVLNSLHLNA
eukprot:10822-Heterococcus_DN1.PRE.3